MFISTVHQRAVAWHAPRQASGETPQNDRVQLGVGQEWKPTPVAPAPPPPAPPSAWESKELIRAFPTEIPAQFRVKPEDNPPVWLCGGEVIRAENHRPVYSRVALREGDELKPQLIGYEPELTPADAARAVAASQKAWGAGEGTWPSMTPEQRIASVEKFLQLIEKDQDRLANLLMAEIGKPLSAAKKEIARTVQFTRDKIAEYREMLGEGAIVSGKEGGEMHYGKPVPKPKGVVLAVGPFNYPFNESWTSIFPALLTGNVVMAKLPRFGKLSNQALAQMAKECFPPGALNLLPGDGRKILPEIMKAEELVPGQGRKGVVDVFVFIGSEKACNAIKGAHPTPDTLTVASGLGAKNAAVVLPNAQIDEVAKKIVKGALGFNGQRCTAEKIVFVHRSQGDQLAAAIRREVEKLKVGMPHEDADITPLPEDDKLKWMRDYLDDAASKGAQVWGGEGTFSLMKPAVVYGVTGDMKLYHEEQFGPIIPIAVYDDINEVYDYHRNSPFGQQASVWGPPDKVGEVAETLLNWVDRTNENLTCKRGPDHFQFSALKHSGVGECCAFETYVKTRTRVRADQDDF